MVLAAEQRRPEVGTSFATEESGHGMAVSGALEVTVGEGQEINESHEL